MCLVSKGIVELHGGSISVTSEGIGKGSCFSVEIPISSNYAVSDEYILGHNKRNKETSTRNPSSTSNKKMNNLSLKQLSYGPYSFPCNCISSIINRCRRHSIVSENVSIKPHRTTPSINMPHDLNESIGHTRNLPLKCFNILERSRSFENDITHDVTQCNEKVDDDVTPVVPQKFSRVLIVDDVPMNRKMLKRLLTDRFDKCKEAENGQQAVEMVKEAMASGMNYDVITMDFQMPVMDGVTATSNIRGLGYTGQIIGVTGNALSEDINYFLNNGANIVLMKPLSISTLDEYLKTIG